MSHPCHAKSSTHRSSPSGTTNGTNQPQVLAVLLLSTIGGLLAAPILSPLPLPLLWPTLLALIWGILRNTRLATISLAVFCALLAITQYQRQISPPLPEHHVALLPQRQPLTIEGRVQAIHGGDPLRIDLDTDHLVNDSASHALTGRLRLTIGEGKLNFQVGQRIRFRGSLRSPEPFGTPGEFDYAQYLAARSIFVTAYVNRAEDIVAFATERGAGILRRLAALRHIIGERIDEAVTPDQKTLVRALVIGDRQLTSAQRQQLAETGLSHLFAISGLHLGLLALLLYSGGRWLYRRSERLLLLAPPGRLLPVMLLPLLWLYLQLSGNALSTRRAFLMTVVGALLLLIGRRIKPMHGLAAVALLMLCGSPLCFFEPAWQLSMAGVGGILLLLPAWQRYISAWPRWSRWPSGLAATTLAATIATTPLVLYHFHLLAPAGLLSNLLAVPLIGFGAVPLGLSGTLIDPLWPSAGAALYRLCGHLCQLTLQGATHLSQAPLLSAKVCYFSPRILLGLTLSSLLLLVPYRAGRWLYHRGPLLVAALLLLFLPPSIPEQLTVTALSVGQGEALLLSRPQAGHYLIDGGGIYGSTFDVGTRLVAPALARLGVSSLEAVILTHDHPDHRQGLVEILNHFPVKAFWSAQTLAELHPEIREPLQKKGIPLLVFTEGWSKLDQGTAGELAIYVPPQKTPKINNRSLVLYARHGQEGLLLTGDLERQGVDDLLNHPPAGPVTLLKLPHHGSRYSEPWRLTEELHPQMVFASSGRHNRYGLPHKMVIQSLSEQGLKVYDTGQDGSLRFGSDNSGWHLQHWEKGLFR
ncbi:DNA internalization-related competence protein ComEC/Rec2 [Syntrophotalea acetylenivorans]|uniref:DNA internalization-related competence protein ComEC/Rec2 n=1 Tax=Syntrophotalea acetylenivorans TaxID=1842532 RepID=UPI0009FA126F|nr:DNA internalization-related competence protein ComEC/Rec2 [Syntrophotalea acetylenivorans]